MSRTSNIFEIAGLEKFSVVVLETVTGKSAGPTGGYGRFKPVPYPNANAPHYIVYAKNFECTLDNIKDEENRVSREMNRIVSAPPRADGQVVGARVIVHNISFNKVVSNVLLPSKNNPNDTTYLNLRVDNTVLLKWKVISSVFQGTVIAPTVSQNIPIPKPATLTPTPAATATAHVPDPPIKTGAVFTSNELYKAKLPLIYLLKLQNEQSHSNGSIDLVKLTSEEKDRALKGLVDLGNYFGKLGNRLFIPIELEKDDVYSGTTIRHDNYSIMLRTNVVLSKKEISQDYGTKEEILKAIR